MCGFELLSAVSILIISLFGEVLACLVPGSFGPFLPLPQPPLPPHPCWLICLSVDVMLIFVDIVVVELLFSIIECCRLSLLSIRS